MKYLWDVLRYYKQMTAEEAEQYIIEQAEESKALKFCLLLAYMILCAVIGVAAAIYVMRKYGG